MLRFSQIDSAIPSATELKLKSIFGFLPLVQYPDAYSEQLRIFVENRKSEQDKPLTSLDIKALFEVFDRLPAKYAFRERQLMVRMSKQQVSSYLSLVNNDIKSKSNNVGKELNWCVQLRNQSSREDKERLSFSLSKTQYSTIIPDLISEKEVERIILSDNKDSKIESLVYKERIWGVGPLVSSLIKDDKPAAGLVAYMASLSPIETIKLIDDVMLSADKKREPKELLNRLFLCIPNNQHTYVVNSFSERMNSNEKVRAYFVSILQGDVNVYLSETRKFVSTKFHKSLAEYCSGKELILPSVNDAKEYINSLVKFEFKVPGEAMSKVLESIESHITQITTLYVLQNKFPSTVDAQKFSLYFHRFLNKAWINKHRTAVDELTILIEHLSKLQSDMKEDLTISKEWMNCLCSVLKFKESNNEVTLFEQAEKSREEKDIRDYHNRMEARHELMHKIMSGQQAAVSIQYIRELHPNDDLEKMRTRYTKMGVHIFDAKNSDERRSAYLEQGQSSTHSYMQANTMWDPRISLEKGLGLADEKGLLPDKLKFLKG